MPLRCQNAPTALPRYHLSQQSQHMARISLRFSKRESHMCLGVGTDGAPVSQWPLRAGEARGRCLRPEEGRPVAGACAEEGPAADGVLGGAGWPVAAGAGGASQSPLAGAGGPVAGAHADAECRLGMDGIRAGGSAGACLQGGGGGKPVATEAGRVGWPLARGSGGVVAAFFAGTHANMDSQTGHMTPLQGSVDGWTPL